MKNKNIPAAGSELVLPQKLLQSSTLLSLTGEERKQVNELVESTLPQVQVKRGG